MSDLNSLIETLRADLHAKIDVSCNDLLAKLTGNKGPDTAKAQTFRVPTLVDGHDPRNKNGLNLTPRGIEILYRIFDDNGGYNRAAKMLNISQGAAKNRKAIWTREGGKNRTKLIIDIDAI
jgi:hypothetical protein